MNKSILNFLQTVDTSRFCVAVLVFLLLTACGGGGSDDGADSGGRLTIHISYPTANANLGGFVTQTTVTGYLEDEGDGVVSAGDVSLIEVNGHAAVLSQDDPSRWSVQVPMNLPRDTLVASVESRSGLRSIASQIVNNQPMLIGILPDSIDSVNNRILSTGVTPDGSAALIWIDLVSGERTVISAANKGSGPLFTDPRSMAWDAANNRALILDNELIAVDLASGNRTVISGNGVGSGPNFTNPRSLSFDAANNRVLILQRDALFSVSLANGDRTIISASGIGTGLDFVSPWVVVLDVANNRALVPDSDALLAVNLANGDRTVISDNNDLNLGLDYRVAASMVLDAANNRVLLLDPFSEMLFSVNLANGQREIFAGTSGTFIPHSMVLDTAGDRILIVWRNLTQLLSRDLSDFSFSILSDLKVGAGPKFFMPNSIALDGENNRALVTENNMNTLLSVDLSTFERAVLSRNFNTGSGPTFFGLDSVALDVGNNRALTVSNFALMSVALDTGNRTHLFSDSTLNTGFGPTGGLRLGVADNRAFVLNPNLRALVAVTLDDVEPIILSDDNNGIGPTFMEPVALELDPANNRALIIDKQINNDVLMSVDLNSGARSVLADNPVFSELVALQLDAVNNRVLALSQSLPGLVAIDLARGDQAVLSSAQVGVGPNFIEPLSMQLDMLNNRVFVIDSSRMMVVDLGTGDRAIASR